MTPRDLAEILRYVDIELVQALDRRALRSLVERTIAWAAERIEGIT